MRTIAVIARKGGSGKTTVAMHLALAAHLRGFKVLVADTDPQGSSMEVLSARRAAGPRGLATTGAELAVAREAAIREGYDAMIVDTPAGVAEDLAHAIAIADLSLLVLRPTYLDLAAAVRTLDVIRRLRRPAVGVLNQAPIARDGVEPPLVKRALEALGVMRLATAPSVLRSRLIYQSALALGRSAEESVDRVAAGEVAAFWTFIERFAFAKRVSAAA